MRNIHKVSFLWTQQRIENILVDARCTFLYNQGQRHAQEEEKRITCSGIKLGIRKPDALPTELSPRGSFCVENFLIFGHYFKQS